LRGLPPRTMHRPREPLFMPGTRPDGASPLPPETASIVREFVAHWGLMARAWGINATMGELFALLYISAREWNAEELRDTLGVSRGNISMNLRELLNWGVVHKVHRPGDRREYFCAEGDVWVLFRRILRERKRRELDPTLDLLARTNSQLQNAPDQEAMFGRIHRLDTFFRQINGLASRLLELTPEELDALLQFVGPDDELD
jgi:DNA-binding transcriptional regulator GbsR (MarR family)